MADVKVEVKQLRRAMFALRGRFLKLQNVIVGEALLAASEPVVAAAQAGAPVLTGRLRGRIGPRLVKAGRGRPISVVIGAIKHSRNDKQFPFWDRFQERGFRAMGRANRRTFKGSPRKIPGKKFLEKAGRSQADRARQIFAARVFQRFSEIRDAGIAAGLF